VKNKLLNQQYLLIKFPLFKSRYVYLLSLCFSTIFAQDSEQFMPSEPIENHYSKGYNVPARFEMDHPCDINMSSSFIYWQASEGGLEVASLNADVGHEDQIASKLVAMDFSFKPGFKIDFGVNFVHDSWTAFGEYTRLYLTDTTSSYAGENCYLRASWLDVQIDQEASVLTHVEGLWRLNFNALDISFSRPFYLGYMVTIEPIFGLKAWWIGQTYNAFYTYAVVENSEVRSYKHTRIWGLGPRVGLNGNWLIGKGFKINGKLFGSLLYEHFKTKSQIYFSDNVLFYNQRYSVSQVAPVIETAFGMGWGSYLAHNKVHLDFFASYEIQTLFSQNVLRNYKDMAKENIDSNIGDLFLQGLTLTLKIDL
jgi:hypothetical protein